MSSTTSSPSLYSHAPSHAYHPSQISARLRELAETEEPEDDRRMSMVAGPTLRKYADNPWEEEPSRTIGDFGRSATKMVKGMGRSKSRSRASPMADAAFNRAQISPSGSEETISDTRKALYGLVAKRLLPSPSGMSIHYSNRSSSSNSTISSAPVQTPRASTVEPLLEPFEPSPDHPPLRGKRSGLLRLFKAPKEVPNRPRRTSDAKPSRASMWSNDSDDYPRFQDEISAATIASVKPQLELRPISMTFKGLPDDYLSRVEKPVAEPTISAETRHANARKAWQM